MIDDEKDYKNLLKTNHLEEITIPKFKNFIRNLDKQENYFYELLAQCLIKVKREYQKQYNPNKKEMNFLIIDPISLRCMKEEIYDVLENDEE